jgi:phage major head subunit gpT-like protein
MTSPLQIFGVNSPNVSELFTLMIAKYKDALAQMPKAWAAGLCGMSSTAELRQKFPIDLTTLNGFREWGGPRDAKDSDLTAFYIDSKPWERTIDVDLDSVFARDFAPYVNKVPNLMRAAAIMPNRLMASLLKAGKTATCWDGQYFFDTDHPVDYRNTNTSATYRNLYTAMPFNRANFALAKQYLRAMKAPDGVTPLGLELTHVLGDTSLEETFDQLFKKFILANDAGTAADTNIYQGGAVPVIGPELDANGEAGVWYGVAMNTDARPVEQQWKGGAGNPEIRILGDGTEFATTNNKVRFAGKIFGNAGYAIPHCIIRFEPS